MLLDALERLAVPIIIVLFGAGGAGSIWLSRRQTAATANRPQLPADAPDPDGDPIAVNTWLLSEVGRMRERLGDFDRLLEEVPPYIRWQESGARPPARMLSPGARKILGLEP